MNNRLMLMLALVALSAGGLSPAQQRKAVGKASPKLFIAKVTQVDERTKAVTIAREGRREGHTQLLKSEDRDLSGRRPGGRLDLAPESGRRADRAIQQRM